jgi:amidohydrolase
VADRLNYLKDQVIHEIDKIKSDLHEISDYIFNNPETSFQEYKAVEALTGELERHGFKVEKGVGGLETAFKASYSGAEQGPNIALLAEYDALPELGHACGHNIIGTSSIGAAIGLSKLMGELGGTITVLGTPAEEGGGGKVIMINEGVFAGLDAALMIHPADYNMVQDISLANENLTLTFHGKSAHAAAFPEKGINALEGIIQTFNGINALRQHLKADARIHGIITKGGVASNIVPDLAQAVFSIRALSRAYLDEIVEKVENCIRGAALATGATPELQYKEFSYDEVRNNSVLEDLLRANYEKIGLTVTERTLEQGVGSTDMGNVTQTLPGIHAYIGLREGLVTHTPNFAEAAGSEEGREAVIQAARALAMTVIDLLARPELVVEMKREFRRMKEGV